MNITGHIRGRDLDGIKNNTDAYKYGVPVFFGSSSYRDDIEYIGCIVNHIRTLFPDITSSQMFVRNWKRSIQTTTSGTLWSTLCWT